MLLQYDFSTFLIEEYRRGKYKIWDYINNLVVIVFGFQFIVVMFFKINYFYFFVVVCYYVIVFYIRMYLYVK